MSMQDYLKSCIWEWILGILVSWGLCQIFFHGFYIAESWQGNYLCSLLVISLLTAGCLTGAYNKRSVKIAVPSGIVVMILALVLVQQISQSQNVFRDQEENAGIYFLILILTSLAVFFLSRTRIGSGILFVGGSFFASTIQFLYETSEIRWLILFLCSAGAMYLYKTYQKNVRENSTVKADFRRAFLTATVACIVILLLSSGIFYGIVKPLDPPTRDLKLITKYMSLEVLEKTGVADTHILNDTDEKTDNVNEEENDSKKKGDKEDQTEGEKSKQEDQEQKDKKENPTRLDDMLNQLFYAIKYIAAKITPMLLIPFLILLILAVILTKILLRKRWLKKVLEKERRDQIIEFYEFYIKRFQKMKVRKAPEETPYEFAERSAPYLREFHVENTSFADLTDTFVKARYSEDKVTDTIKPVSGNPMGADLTPQSGYEDLTLSGTDQVPHSIGMKADVLLGINGSGGKTYDDYIKLMKDNYDPIQVAYRASNLGDFIDDMYNLSDAIVKSGKKGRYGDTTKIANNYESYIKGLQLYVMSQIDAGKVEKKTIAVINSTQNSDGTYTAYTSSVTAGTAASCRAAEYIETTTNNLIDVLGVENSGTAENKQYLLTAEQLLKADAIYTTVQGNSTTGEAFREQLKTATGASDDKIPAIYSQDPAGVFGIQMNSVENIAGIGIYQGFLYPEILNPVYAYTYIVENFYHVTEAKDYKAVTETLLADCSLPKGYEADASGYTTDYITSRINTGLNYYYNNESKFKGLKVEPTDRLDFTATPEKPAVTTVSISKATVGSISNKAYTGKSQTPTVKVTVNGKTLKKDTDYTVTYKNNKYPGKATITIKGKGNYTGTKTVTFKIVPKKATVSSVSSTKKGALTVKVKKDSTAAGYQIMIAKNSKFTSGMKSYVSSKNTTVSKTFTSLTKGKKYYVKVRAYEKIDGKKVYGAWSSVKTKTVKK